MPEEAQLWHSATEHSRLGYHLLTRTQHVQCVCGLSHTHKPLATGLLVGGSCTCRTLLPPHHFMLRAPGLPFPTHSPRRWLYTPYAASSTRQLLSSFTAMVDPRLVTACPTSVTPAATNAAMLSVVPPQTRVPVGRPAHAAAAGVTGATGAPGATTRLGRRCA